VFLDADDDGTRDPGERGLAGIVVSDQIAVTMTDAEGRYALPGSRSELVFVSLPRAHRSVNGFWRRRDMGAVDFALQATNDAGTFTR
jgi:hypothetical protein